jgi:hypothetical protein
MFLTGHEPALDFAARNPLTRLYNISSILVSLTVRNLTGETMMQGAGLGLGRALGAAMIFSLALSAVAVRAEGEMGPPCSATVKDHCMEGGAGAVKTWHKRVVHHRKHQTAMATTKPTPAPAAKPAAKPKGK